jgi:hypothetical protein
MNEPMRVLVTGSREWDAFDVIHDELDLIAMKARQYRQPLVVVHGKNPRGGDRAAAVWAAQRAREGWPVTEEPHPADWDAPCRPECKEGHRRERRNGTTYCPAAGQYRNADMVLLGADYCLAFIRANSAGATNCARLAEEHAIRTLRFHWESYE